MSRMQKLLGVLALVGLGTFASGVWAHDVGPHKGQVVEWGEEEYHLEFVPDAKTGMVTVYIYGSHEDLDKAKATAIDSKSLVLTLKTTPTTTIKLEPKPSKGDAAGKGSISNTSSAQPASRPVRSASGKALSSTSWPRPTLITYVPRHAASRFRSRKWKVSSVSGQARISQRTP